MMPLTNRCWTLLIKIGCVNDTAVMKKFLLRPDVGFAEENIRVLTDDQVGTEWMPTRENIFRQLKWLIQDAKENDSYVYPAAIPRIMEFREYTIDGSLTLCIFAK